MNTMLLVAVSAAVALQQAKAPPPAAAEQARAEKEIRSLFKDDLARKDRDGKRAAAVKFLAQAGDSRNQPVSRYVLLGMTRDLATEALDVTTCFAALEQLDLGWETGRDLFVQKATALLAARKNATSAEDSSKLADAHLGLVDHAVAANRFDDALAAADHASKIAKDPERLGRARRLAQQIPLLKSEAEAARTAELGLAADPDDPEANLVLGRYIAFARGDWDRALPLLAKGEDAALAEVARSELARAGDPEALGEAWWRLSEREKNPLHKGRYADRAGQLLEQALAETKGLARLKIEKRLLEIGHKPGKPSRFLDLLPMIDPLKDMVQGQWSAAPGSLTSPVTGMFDLIEIPYAPGAEYDLRLLVERKEGDSTLTIGLVAGGRQFVVQLDGWAERDVCGLSLVDGKDSRFNETTVKKKIFSNGKTVALTCAVRRTTVEVSVGGEKLLSFSGDPARLSVPQYWKSRNTSTLFLSSSNTRYVFTKIQLVAHAGEGKPLR